MEEKDLLGLLHCSWVTNLEYAFQDDDYLYLVMEYLAGGNMLNLLFKHGSFEEEKARFYIAEAIQGVQKIHELGFVYRFVSLPEFSSLSLLFSLQPTQRLFVFPGISNLRTCSWTRMATSSSLTLGRASSSTKTDMWIHRWLLELPITLPQRCSRTTTASRAPAAGSQIGGRLVLCSTKCSARTRHSWETATCRPTPWSWTSRSAFLWSLLGKGNMKNPADRVNLLSTFRINSSFQTMWTCQMRQKAWWRG